MDATVARRIRPAVLRSTTQAASAPPPQRLPSAPLAGASNVAATSRHGFTTAARACRITGAMTNAIANTQGQDDARNSHRTEVTPYGNRYHSLTITLV